MSARKAIWWIVVVATVLWFVCLVLVWGFSMGFEGSIGPVYAAGFTGAVIFVVIGYALIWIWERIQQRRKASSKE